ncbi:hypothetical protein ABIB15_000994 [Marisediminicola sp. UYEF4]|uniref:hypothetical protein n=1 Tax=Marisediminicola sp. UYEF4 TaxID=1756384 RepID=UPI0033990F9E
MRLKLIFIVGLAAGYVLGARSGRAPYERLKAKSTEAWEDPRVQKVVHEAEDFVKENAPIVADKVAEGAKVAAQKIAEGSKVAAEGAKAAGEKIAGTSKIAGQSVSEGAKVAAAGAVDAASKIADTAKDVSEKVAEAAKGVADKVTGSDSSTENDTAASSEGSSDKS